MDKHVYYEIRYWTGDPEKLQEINPGWRLSTEADTEMLNSFPIRYVPYPERGIYVIIKEAS